MRQGKHLASHSAFEYAHAYRKKPMDVPADNCDHFKSQRVVIQARLMAENCLELSG